MIPLAKVLFIGIDACDKFLLQSWAADGTLSNFRALLDGSLVGDTMSLEGFFEGSTWPSFYTGVTPARHGFHRLVQLRPGTYQVYRCSPGRFIRREPFWNYLSRAGRRVAVLDIPLSSISRGIYGMQMVEWGSHDAASGFRTWPPRLKREVASKFGFYPLKETCNYFARKQELSALKDLLVEGVKRKTELTNYYLDMGNWDFFGQVFSEGHCIGHQCFHLHDLTHPSYDPETASTTGDLIREVYTTIDAAIGRILERVDNDTVVVLLASHGMSHSFGAQILLPDILVRLGVTAPLLPETEAAKFNETTDRVPAFLGWWWRQMPEGVKARLRFVRNRVHGWFYPDQLEPLRGIDFRNSKCFPLDNGLSVGGIRLNLAGREPHGVLKPGEEVDVFCDELIHDLMKIVDHDTNLSIVTSVRRTDELYEGECLNHLPDLLVEWSDEKRLGSAGTGNPRGSKLRLSSDKIGLVEGTYSYCRTGDHRPEGLFIAYGPGIREGHLDRTVSIMDFAPTFTRMLGVELPDADGNPIEEILKAAPHTNWTDSLGA
jgi:predicted AlkP superfamily phosphohydrolase/phosphomutase